LILNRSKLDEQNVGISTMNSAELYKKAVTINETSADQTVGANPHGI
jgi:hypothetical protein